MVYVGWSRVNLTVVLRVAALMSRNGPWKVRKVRHTWLDDPLIFLVAKKCQSSRASIPSSPPLSSGPFHRHNCPKSSKSHIKKKYNRCEKNWLCLNLYVKWRELNTFSPWNILFLNLSNINLTFNLQFYFQSYPFIHIKEKKEETHAYE